MTRVLAVVGAALVLAASGWFAWWLLGDGVRATAGVGPAEGVVRVTECHDGDDGDGRKTGYECAGTFAPATGAERPIVLADARARYPRGTTVPVRLAWGEAYETSAREAAAVILIACAVASPGVLTAVWLLASARSGEPAEYDGLVMLGAALPLGLAAIAAVVR
ncbi:hypothetical protein ACFVHB_26125 [Kitasatospora sp. NPDC127111]|uniref:hypothetical protein n=1 Tax=Kitasatospora sp. NPDC127111 TaxID=3345363 RepID=UPI003626EB36